MVGGKSALDKNVKSGKDKILLKIMVKLLNFYARSIFTPQNFWEAQLPYQKGRSVETIFHDVGTIDSVLDKKEYELKAPSMSFLDKGGAFNNVKYSQY